MSYGIKIRTLFNKYGILIYNKNNKEIYAIGDIYLEKIKNQNINIVRNNNEIFFIMNSFRLKIEDKKSCVDIISKIKSYTKKQDEAMNKSIYMNTIYKERDSREKELIMKMQTIISQKSLTPKAKEKIDEIFKETFSKDLINKVKKERLEYEEKLRLIEEKKYREKLEIQRKKLEKERHFEDIKRFSKYPNDVKPENKDPEEIMDILNELDEMFEDSEEAKKYI